MRARFMILLLTLCITRGFGISIAVLDFEPRGINSDQAVIITDILRTELLKTGRITIVEREKINALLKERQLSEVGVTESVELGKVLGVDKIIFGRIGMLGDSYVVTVRMIDVASGKVDFADQYTCQMTTDFITGVMKEIAQVVQRYLPPIEGKVVLRKDDIVYITLSSKEDLKEGMELTVYRVEQVKDEEGNVIFEDMREIGKIKVLKVSDKGSSAKVLSEGVKIEKGDIVKLPAPQVQLERVEAAKTQKEEAKPMPPEKPATAPALQQPASKVGTGYLKIIIENPRLLFKARLLIDGCPVLVPPEMIKEGVIYLESVPAGKRVVKITGPAIEDLIKEVEVEKDELVRVRVRLEVAKGELLIKTQPIGASVVVDGRRIEDKTPTLLKLPVGRHEIVVGKEGFKSERFKFLIMKGKRKVINLRLERAAYVPHYYWIQDKKKVWIKGDWEGEKVLYVFYGAAGGDPRKKWENGDEVFEFFEDFDYGVIGPIGTVESHEKYGLKKFGWYVWDYDEDGYIQYYVHDGIIEINYDADENTLLFKKLPFNIDKHSKLAIEYKAKTGKTSGKGEAILLILDDYCDEAKNGFHIYPFNTGYEPNYWSLRVGYEYEDDEFLTDNILENLPYRTWCNFKIDIWDRRITVAEVCENGLKQTNSKIIESYHRPKGKYVGIRSCCDTHSRHAIYDYIIIYKNATTYPKVEYIPEESGTWQIAGYTFTKRRKIIVRSSKPLKDFQIALDFSKFGDEHLMIVEEKR